METIKTGKETTRKGKFITCTNCHTKSLVFEEDVTFEDLLTESNFVICNRYLGKCKCPCCDEILTWSSEEEKTIDRLETKVRETLFYTLSPDHTTQEKFELMSNVLRDMGGILNLYYFEKLDWRSENE